MKKQSILIGLLALLLAAVFARPFWQREAAA